MKNFSVNSLKIKNFFRNLAIKKKEFFIVFFLVVILLFSPMKIAHGMGTTDAILAFLILIGPLIFYFIAYGVALVVAIICDLVILELTKRMAANPITQDPIFLSGWTLARDVANILIVIAIFGIAVATILRFKEYEAKKLLFPIIILALLINFSNVFVGLIIDASDIAMSVLIGKSAYKFENKIKELGEIGDEAIKSEIETMLKTNTSGSSWTSYMKLFSAVLKATTVIVQFGFIYLLVAFVFFLFSVLMVVRYAVLGFLFIFAPLAFLFRTFPLEATKKLWTNWFNNLTKWAFVGIGLGFSIKLAFQMLETLGGISNDQKSTIFNVFVVIIILLIGLKVTLKSSALGAAAVGGLATAAAIGGAGLVLGAGKKILGGMGKVTGISGGLQRAKEWIGDRFTGAGEKIGLLNRGTLAQKQAARAEKEMGEAKGRVGLLSDQELARMANSSAFGRQARIDKAAAIENMLEKGKLSELGSVSNQVSALQYLESRYPTQNKRRAIWEKASQKNPELAVYNKWKMDELKSKNPQKAGETETQYQQRLQNMAQKDAYSNFKIDNLDNKSNEDIIEEAKKGGARGAKHLEEAVRRNIYEQIGTFDEVAKLMAKAKNDWGSNALNQAVKSTPGFRAYDDKAVLERAINNAKAAGIPWNAVINKNRALEIARRELVVEEYRNKDQVSSLSKFALNDPAFLYSMRPKQIGQQMIHPKFPADKYDEVKKWVTDSNKQREALDKMHELRIEGETELYNNMSEAIGEIAAS